MSLINAISISSSGPAAAAAIGRIPVRLRRACFDARARSSIIPVRENLLKKLVTESLHRPTWDLASNRNRRGADLRPRPENSPTIRSTRDRLPLLPLEELPEQRLPVLGSRARPHLVFAQELIEAAARIGGGHGAAVAIEPFLRRLEPRPAGQRRIERHFLPFRMERWL